MYIALPWQKALKMFLKWKLIKHSKRILTDNVMKVLKLLTTSVIFWWISRSEFHGPAVPHVTTTHEHMANNNKSRARGRWLERSSWFIFPIGISAKNIFKRKFDQMTIFATSNLDHIIFVQSLSNISLKRTLGVEKLCQHLCFHYFINKH